MVTRIDQLSAPPEVGRVYIVPTVQGTWNGVRQVWPVFLPRHEDADHLDFPYWHYHLDSRFLSERVWADAANNRCSRSEALVQSLPLHAPPYRGYCAPVVWRWRECKRAMPDYYHGDAAIIQHLRAIFAGRQCRKGKTGWICPHKNITLGSVPAVDGVITCPGHGLRICASSGEVLS